MEAHSAYEFPRNVQAVAQKQKCVDELGCTPRTILSNPELWYQQLRRRSHTQPDGHIVSWKIAFGISVAQKSSCVHACVHRVYVWCCSSPCLQTAMATDSEFRLPGKALLNTRQRQPTQGNTPRRRSPVDIDTLQRQGTRAGCCLLYTNYSVSGKGMINIINCLFQVQVLLLPSPASSQKSRCVTSSAHHPIRRKIKNNA